MRFSPAAHLYPVGKPWPPNTLTRQLRERGGKFQVLRKVLLGQRHRDIISLGQVHARVHKRLPLNLQLTKALLRIAPYLQRRVGFTAARNITDARGDGSYSSPRFPKYEKRRGSDDAASNLGPTLGSDFTEYTKYSRKD